MKLLKPASVFFLLLSFSVFFTAKEARADDDCSVSCYHGFGSPDWICLLNGLPNCTSGKVCYQGSHEAMRSYYQNILHGVTETPETGPEGCQPAVAEDTLVCDNACQSPPPPDGGLTLPPIGQCAVDADGGNMRSNCKPGQTPIVTSIPAPAPYPPGHACECKDAATELEEFFGIINGILIPITIILGMFIIVRAGYSILTSQGDPQKLQEGKENLTSAIIGLIFVLMAVSILRVIIKALITGDKDPFS